MFKNESRPVIISYTKYRLLMLDKTKMILVIWNLNYNDSVSELVGL